MSDITRMKYLSTQVDHIEHKLAELHFNDDLYQRLRGESDEYYAELIKLADKHAENSGDIDEIPESVRCYYE